MRKVLALLIALLLCCSLVLPQTKLGGTAKLGGTVKSGAATAGGGGSDFATDTFTEASALTLASHNPEVGGPITKHPGAAYVSTATINEATDTVFPAGTTAYYYAGSPPSADYYVQSDITAVSITSISAGACGHMDTSADTMVCWRLNNGTSWDLRQIVSGSGSTLGTSTTNLPSTGESRTVKLIFSSGGTQASLEVNGSQVVAPQTITVTAAGNVGMRFASGAGPSSGFHLDNFSAR